jgi:hypothetical protein
VIDFCKFRQERPRRRYSVGVPFVLLLFLLSPLLVLTPIAFIACLIARIDPFEAARALWHVLTALRGTRVEIAQRDRSVLVHIS